MRGRAGGNRQNNKTVGKKKRVVVGNLLPPCELKFGMQQSTLPTSLTVLELMMITQRVIWKHRSMRPAPAKLGGGPVGPSQAGPDRNQQESGCISNDSSVVCYLLKKCNIDVKTCNCYFFELDYEPIRLI